MYFISVVSTPVTWEFHSVTSIFFCFPQIKKNLFPVHLLCLNWGSISIIYIVRDIFAKLKNCIPRLTVIFWTFAPTWSGALICSDTHFVNWIKFIHSQVLHTHSHILLCMWLSLRTLACLFSNTTMFLALPMQILTGEYCFCWEWERIVCFFHYCFYRC